MAGLCRWPHFVAGGGGGGGGRGRGGGRGGGERGKAELRSGASTPNLSRPQGPLPLSAPTAMRAKPFSPHASPLHDKVWHRMGSSGNGLAVDCINPGTLARAPWSAHEQLQHTLTRNS